MLLRVLQRVGQRIGTRVVSLGVSQQCVGRHVAKSQIGRISNPKAGNDSSISTRTGDTKKHEAVSQGWWEAVTFDALLLRGFRCG